MNFRYMRKERIGAYHDKFYFAIKPNAAPKMKRYKGELKLRALTQADCKIISEAFQAQGWNKPIAQYQRYLVEQEKGHRTVIIATLDGLFAGYVTICWSANYAPFRARGIPEVVDFNVLKKYQRQGIGTAIMDEAERKIRQVSKFAGIGFGVTADYGAAQILYIKRHYIPDGCGLVKKSRSLNYGEEVIINDDLVFCLIKEL